MTARHATGAQGEALVAQLLVERGFRIVGRNVRAGGGEIDIIAEDGCTLVFCEVRTLRSRRLYAPVESIDRKKIARVRRTAAAWLQANGGPTKQVRFDAASVCMDREPASIDYYEAAF